MPDTQTVARAALAATGEANVATGVPVLDHLVGALARAGRLKVALEVAPDAVDEQVVAAGRSFGRALGELVRADGAAGTGWAMATADEAFAAASLEVADRPLLAANVEFSGQRVAGIATDVVSRFLEELAGGAGLNLHVRLFEGDDPQHVLLALFKAVGAAAGLACRPPHEGGEG